MKEKLLFIFALLLTAVTGAWAVDNSGSCGTDVSYTYVESTHTLTISGTGAMADYNYPSEQPWYSYATEIETVIIKDGVTGIGNCAFLNCTGLTTVTIGTGVTYIGIDAFLNCTNVTDVYCNADPEKLTWDESNCDDFKNDGTTIIHVADAAPWYTKFGGVVNGTFIDKPYVPLSWNYDAATKTLTLSGTVIPSYDDLDECPWIDYVEEVENIVIEDDVTRIGNHAFEDYESLTTVTIPASVTSIGYYAFSGCSGLTTVTIGSGVTYIGRDTFFNCTNVEVVYCNADPEKLTWDENDCNDFKQDGSTVIKVADAAPWIEKFTGVVNGTFIDTPYVPLTWNYDADTKTLTFSGTVIPSYEDPEECPWKDYVEVVENIVIEDDVTRIGNYAFYGCSGLTTVTIGSGVTYIGYDAFFNCTNVEVVYCNANPATLKWEESGCDDFKKDGSTIIHVADADPWIDNFTGEVNGTFSDKPYVPLTWNYDADTRTLTFSGTVITSYEDPEERPWKDYFAEVENIVIEDDVTRIGNLAFVNFDGLTTVTFATGSKLETIGEAAFNNCFNLATVTIPASVTTIGDYAFGYCSNLATVTVFAPSCTLGDYAFNNCDNLTNIYVFSDRVEYYKGAANWNDYAGKITAMTPVASGECGKDNPGDVTWRLEGESGHYRLIISGTGAMEDYQPWNSYAGDIANVVIGNGVTSIGNYAFESCTGLTSIEIPASVTTIGDEAFLGCESLTTVTIPASVTSIGMDAFSFCFGLTTVTIPASVTSIGNYAFMGCESLTTITIPASVTSIGFSAFSGCSDLATMTVEAGNTVYDSRDNCNAIIEKSTNTLIAGCKGTTIPTTVTSIGDFAFESCFGLTTVTIPAGVTYIGNEAFYDCTGLTSITIPASVTSIGFSAFGYCSNIATMTVEAGNTVYDSRDNCNAIIEKESNTLIAGCKNTIIPDDVTSIGNAAFSSCSGLTSITIPVTVTSIGDAAFQCCNGLTSITIPATVTSIGDYAFGECVNLATVTVFAPSCTLGNYAFNNCDNLTNIYVLSDKVSQYKTTWSAYADKISVMFDGTSTTTVNFDNDVTVNGVLYNRTFTASKPSTVMLPFSKAVDDIGGGKFYTFGGVEKEDNKWVATMNEVTGSLTKNTPYLFVPTGTSLTFTGGATLNTTDGGGKETADQGSHWTFKGTYEYKEWISGGANAEEIGKAYGFAGVAKDDINVGDFVKVASGAKIRPMGCYLLWSDTPNASRAAARGAATEELPQSITVRLVSADGEVTGIGEIDTKTGEMTFDSEAWYTLNGVRLSGKPTKKGLYINNGKKVVIK